MPKINIKQTNLSNSKILYALVLFLSYGASLTLCLYCFSCVHQIMALNKEKTSLEKFFKKLKYDSLTCSRLSSNNAATNLSLLREKIISHDLRVLRFVYSKKAATLEFAIAGSYSNLIDFFSSSEDLHEKLRLRNLSIFADKTYGDISPLLLEGHCDV